MKLRKLVNVKIFDKNNPNFKIIQTDEEIIKLFNGNTPICSDFEDHNVIGYIKPNNIIGFIGNNLFADVMIDSYYMNKRFKNYEVSVERQDDQSLKILNVCNILFG
jgi:hypothetical protein